jgi:hypothetical protein
MGSILFSFLTNVGSFCAAAVSAFQQVILLPGSMTGTTRPPDRDPAQIQQRDRSLFHSIYVEVAVFIRKIKSKSGETPGSSAFVQAQGSARSLRSTGDRPG